jgi:carbonic anhydrase
MPLPDDLRAAADRWASGFSLGSLRARPRRRLAILTCMDARVAPLRILGLEPGDAHVIRNAGAHATDDALRSLALSHAPLGTEQVLVVGHTECGLGGTSNDDLRRLVGPAAAEVDFLPFASVEEAVRASVARIRESPLLPEGLAASGFVYDVKSGRLREIPG